MITVIAEKPSVAKDIANILGANSAKSGYYSGNGYAVTWAYGHLIQLAFPEHYNVQGFKRENLPIIPDVFQLVPRQIKAEKGYKQDAGALKQLNVIKDLFNDCDKIVCATDAGREGELIFRYIYNFLNCKKPFLRLWISSLTDKAIKEGFNNLKDGKEYDNLYLSAKCRSEADWLIGINASQALSIAAGKGTFSLGRVQTPTLCMVCSRYLENKNFVPVKYWQLRIDTQKEQTPFSVLSDAKFDNQQTAIDILQSLKSKGDISVKSIERKEATQEPPLLYDLTTLQKEANQKLSFSADKTLSIAQTLYEKKFISYPRTGSRYISKDVYEEIPELIDILCSYPRFSEYADNMDKSNLNSRSVDDNKVTDHHALIITENLPGELKQDEKAIYELIAGRMLEAFSPKCIKDITTIVLEGAQHTFTAKGTIIKFAGYKAVFNEVEKDENEAGLLPSVSQGESLNIQEVQLLEKFTKPKAIHTESSLLSAMETAGKELEDEELKATMKDVAGIGTPATRANIIETLFNRQYISREKKSLIPTEKGLAVYNIIREKKIADVELTGMWETALMKIENGKMDADTFKKSNEVYTSQITSELLNVKVLFTDSEQDLSCPKCGAGRILFFPKVVKCNAECGLIIFRNKNHKELSDKVIKELLIQGKTGTIKGFLNKEQKPFDASLSFDEDYKVIFVFNNSKFKKKK